MMRFVHIAYDLNLSQMADEPLVVLAKECQFQPAEQELLLRYRMWSNRLIVQLGRKRGLTLHEIEDAAQDAVFSVIKAVQRYDTRQMGRIQGCSFQAFVGRVATDRFKDFVKKLYRIKTRFGRSLHRYEHKETGDVSGLDANSRLACPKKSNDPVHMSQRREMDAELRRFLDGLDAAACQFMEHLLAGDSLRDASAHAGYSYDKGKRMRRKLRGKIARRLGVPVG